MSLAPFLLAAAAATQAAGVAAALGVAAWTSRRDRTRARVALHQQAARQRVRTRRLLVLATARIEAAHARIADEATSLFDREPHRLISAALALVDHALTRRGRSAPQEPIVTEALLGMRALLQQCIEIVDRVAMETGLVHRMVMESDGVRRPPESRPVPSRPSQPSAEDLNARRAPELEWRLHTARRLLDDFDRGPPRA